MYKGRIREQEVNQVTDATECKAFMRDRNHGTINPCGPIKLVVTFMETRSKYKEPQC